MMMMMMMMMMIRQWSLTSRPEFKYSSVAAHTKSQKTAGISMGSPYPRNHDVGSFAEGHRSFPPIQLPGISDPAIV